MGDWVRALQAESSKNPMLSNKIHVLFPPGHKARHSPVAVGRVQLGTGCWPVEGEPLLGPTQEAVHCSLHTLLAPRWGCRDPWA